MEPVTTPKTPPPLRIPAPAGAQWRRRPPPGVAARWKGLNRLALPAT